MSQTPRRVKRRFNSGAIDACQVRSVVRFSARKRGITPTQDYARASVVAAAAAGPASMVEGCSARRHTLLQTVADTPTGLHSTVAGAEPRLAGGVALALLPGRCLGRTPDLPCLGLLGLGFLSRHLRPPLSKARSWSGRDLSSQTVRHVPTLLPRVQRALGHRQITTTDAYSGE